MTLCAAQKIKCRGIAARAIPPCYGSHIKALHSPSKSIPPAKPQLITVEVENTPLLYHNNITNQSTRPFHDTNAEMK